MTIKLAGWAVRNQNQPTAHVVEKELFLLNITGGLGKPWLMVLCREITADINHPALYKSIGGSNGSSE